MAQARTMRAFGWFLLLVAVVLCAWSPHISERVFHAAVGVGLSGLAMLIDNQERGDGTGNGAGNGASK